MRICSVSPQGESSLAKSRQVTGGGCAKGRDAQRGRRWRVQENSPISSGLGASTQERQNSLPNKPGHKLGPVPNAWAKAWIPLVEAQVIKGPSKQSYLSVPGFLLLT